MIKHYYRKNLLEAFAQTDILLTEKAVGEKPGRHPKDDPQGASQNARKEGIYS